MEKPSRWAVHPMLLPLIIFYRRICWHWTELSILWPLPLLLLRPGPSGKQSNCTSFFRALLAPPDPLSVVPSLILSLLGHLVRIPWHWFWMLAIPLFWSGNMILQVCGWATDMIYFIVYCSQHFGFSTFSYYFQSLLIECGKPHWMEGLWGFPLGPGRRSNSGRGQRIDNSVERQR